MDVLSRPGGGVEIIARLLLGRLPLGGSGTTFALMLEKGALVRKIASEDKEEEEEEKGCE